MSIGTAIIQAAYRFYHENDKKPVELHLSDKDRMYLKSEFPFSIVYQCSSDETESFMGMRIVRKLEGDFELK